MVDQERRRLKVGDKGKKEKADHVVAQLAEVTRKVCPTTAALGVQVDPPLLDATKGGRKKGEEGRHEIGRLKKNFNPEPLAEASGRLSSHQKEQ